MTDKVKLRPISENQRSCLECYYFSRNNNELIMSAIWKGHERSKRIRKQRGEISPVIKGYIEE